MDSIIDSIQEYTPKYYNEGDCINYCGNIYFRSNSSIGSGSVGYDPAPYMAETANKFHVYVNTTNGREALLQEESPGLIWKVSAKVN